MKPLLETNKEILYHTLTTTTLVDLLSIIDYVYSIRQHYEKLEQEIDTPEKVHEDSHTAMDEAASVDHTATIVTVAAQSTNTSNLGYATPLQAAKQNRLQEL